MSKSLNNGKPKPEEISNETSVEEKKWQEFNILKTFPTSKKTYKPGDMFRHHDQKVIDFLKKHKII